MLSFLCNCKVWCPLGDGFSLRFIIFLLHGLLCVFSVVSVFTSTIRGLHPPVLLLQHLLHLAPHLLLLLLLFTATASPVPGG